MLEATAALVAGYLLGSLPFAAWIARLRGAVIFEVGSGNMGAMNTARNLGLGLGALVLALDAAKGALATAVGLALAGFAAPPTGVAAALTAPLAAGLGAILGHAFSLYAGFRGGKGLATALGVALPLYPLGGAAGTALLIVLTLAMRRRSGVAAVITVVLYPGLVALVLLLRGEDAARALAIAIGVTSMAVVVLYKHYAAYRRERRRTG
ncbi:MAG: glycerol-3-phosphate acyltransferase [Deinococcales bacterium]